MNDKPLISRLAKVYKETQYTYFVSDEFGQTVLEGVDELTARMYAMKDEGYSIGRDEEHVRVLDDDTAINYENKDVLSEEDLNE
jgi:hypothetical protein|tara:strand:- start:259 stop:510 length:252 start_codon:yes stop_codon:yes gene_type:complete